MKQLLAIVLLVGVTTAHAEGIMQRVCHEVKGKQVCKNIKVHKKVEGTVVPDAPAKKKKK